MTRKFTLQYWKDEEFYVGKLKEIPGVFSQGETLQELEENILDAFHLMIEDEDIKEIPNVQTKELAVEV